MTKILLKNLMKSGFFNAGKDMTQSSFKPASSSMSSGIKPPTIKSPAIKPATTMGNTASSPSFVKPPTARIATNLNRPLAGGNNNRNSGVTQLPGANVVRNNPPKNKISDNAGSGEGNQDAGAGAGAGAGVGDGYSQTDRLKYMNINPKSLSRGSKEHNDYWNWYNSTIKNGVQTDQTKQNQYLKWSNQAPNWWEQGKRREGAQLDYQQKLQNPNSNESKAIAEQNWKNSVQEDGRKNSWWSLGIDPANIPAGYFPDPNADYSGLQNQNTQPPNDANANVNANDANNNNAFDANGNWIFSNRTNDSQSNLQGLSDYDWYRYNGGESNPGGDDTTKRLEKSSKYASTKSLRKVNNMTQPPNWWQQTRDRRYAQQDAQAASAKNAADEQAKMIWQSQVEDDKRKNMWWSKGVDPDKVPRQRDGTLPIPPADFTTEGFAPTPAPAAAAPAPRVAPRVAPKPAFTPPKPMPSMVRDPENPYTVPAPRPMPKTQFASPMQSMVRDPENPYTSFGKRAKKKKSEKVVRDPICMDCGVPESQCDCGHSKAVAKSMCKCGSGMSKSMCKCGGGMSKSMCKCGSGMSKSMCNCGSGARRSGGKTSKRMISKAGSGNPGLDNLLPYLQEMGQRAYGSVQPYMQMAGRAYNDAQPYIQQAGRTAGRASRQAYNAALNYGSQLANTVRGEIAQGGFRPSGKVNVATNYPNPNAPKYKQIDQYTMADIGNRLKTVGQGARRGQYLDQNQLQNAMQFVRDFGEYLSPTAAPQMPKTNAKDLAASRKYPAKLKLHNGKLVDYFQDFSGATPNGTWVGAKNAQGDLATYRSSIGSMMNAGARRLEPKTDGANSGKRVAPRMQVWNTATMAPRTNPWDTIAPKKEVFTYDTNKKRYVSNMPRTAVVAEPLNAYESTPRRVKGPRGQNASAVPSGSLADWQYANQVTSGPGYDLNNIGKRAKSVRKSISPIRQSGTKHVVGGFQKRQSGPNPMKYFK